MGLGRGMISRKTNKEVESVIYRKGKKACLVIDDREYRFKNKAELKNFIEKLEHICMGLGEGE